jgi:hypothetical protein
MITISEAVRRQLIKKPYIAELLVSGMINVMSLARSIHEQVENDTMKRATIESVAMAIRRTILLPSANSAVSDIFSEAPDIMVRSHLCEFTIKKENSASVVDKLIKTLSLSRESFFTLTQGIFEDTIIASKSFESIIRKTLGLHHIIAFFDRLSAITVRLPPENVDMPGVYYHILKTLAQNGINIVELVSTYREFTIVVKDNDLDETFGSIKSVFG